MSHEVSFEGPALVQPNGLPRLAFDALLECVVSLVDETVGCDRDVPR